MSGLTYRQGRDELERLVLDATPIKTKTYSGQSLWRIENPPVVLVTKPDYGKQVIVTVLPLGAFEDGGDGEYDPENEMIAAYERIKTLVAPTERHVETKAFLEKSEAKYLKLRNDIAVLEAARRDIRREIGKLIEKFEVASQIPRPSVLKQKDDRIAGLERKLDGQRFATEHREADLERLKDVLREIIRFTVECEDDNPLKSALENIIKTKEPGMLNEKFWKGNKIS